MYLVLSPFSSISISLLAVYEIMWKNIIESDRPQMAIWLVRIANWIPKATNTHSELFSFPKPPHVLMNFRGFPPGCGDSVADF